MPKTKSTQPVYQPLIRLMVIIGLVLFIGAGWVWWKEVFNSPQKVFEDMLGTSMSTRSVTKHIETNNEVQSLDQYLQFLSGDKNLVHSLSALDQPAQGAKVTTETIATLDQNFVRYVSIETSEKSETGAELDFSKVLNLWGKSGGNGELINEAMLGVIPVGFVPQEHRQEIVKFIKESSVYGVDYDTVKREEQNGRPRYVYKANISAEPYVEMLKRFSRRVGLTQLESVDPANFRNSPPLEFELTIDIHSRQLTEVKYIAAGRIETFSSYGVRSEPAIPAETISIEELQNRLQSIR